MEFSDHKGCTPAPAQEDIGQQYSLQEALEAIEFGPYQKRLLVVCGIGYAAATMELVLITFLLPQLNKHWGPLSTLQRGSLTSAVFGGSLLGSLFWGYVSDIVGRKFSFVATVVLSAVFGVASAFSPSFAFVPVFRFMVGFALGGNISVDFVLLLEFLPLHQRGAHMTLITLFGVFGVLLTAGVAWVCLPRWGWRWFLGVCSVPSFVLIFLRSQAHESPRFLLAQGRVSEAEAVLVDVAAANSVALPKGHLCPLVYPAATSSMGVGTSGVAADTVDSTLVALVRSPEADSDGALRHRTPAQSGSTLCSVFQQFLLLLSPSLRVTSLLLWMIWFLLTFSYYGITIWLPKYLKWKGLEGELYLTFLLIGVAELPGLALSAYLVEHLGRKHSLSVSLAGCAVFVVLFAFAGSRATVVACTMAIYFCVVGAWSVIYIYSPEVYPTSLRTTASGATSVFATSGGIASPIVASAMFGNHNRHSNRAAWLVILMYCGTFLLAGVVSLALPIVTTGRPLVDLVDEREDRWSGTASKALRHPITPI